MVNDELVGFYCMVVFCVYSLNARKRLMLKRPIGVIGAVSNVRKFKNLTRKKLADLKTNKLKKRTFSKMQWSVRAYIQWRKQKLEDVTNFDIKVFDADIENLGKLDKASFYHAMCRFIAEVTKVKDGTDYPGKTLYEMVTSIQKYLHQNRVMWKLLDDVEFIDLKVVLDNVMKE